MTRVRWATGCVLALSALWPGRTNAQTRPLDCKAWGNKPALGTVCTLAHDDTVVGHRMPAGTRLHYDTLKVLDYFIYAQDGAFEGLELRGTRDGPFQFLYPDGTPKQLWLARTQDVQGVPCRPISFWTEIARRSSAVYFHPGGRLKACRVGREVRIQGVTFRRSERVELDAVGQLVRPVAQARGHMTTRKTPIQRVMFPTPDDVIVPVTSIEWGVPDRWSFTSRYVHMFTQDRDHKRTIHNLTVILSPGKAGGRVGAGYSNIYDTGKGRAPGVHKGGIALLSEARVVVLRTWGEPLTAMSGRRYLGGELRTSLAGVVNVSVGYYAPTRTASGSPRAFWGVHMGVGM